MGEPMYRDLEEYLGELHTIIGNCRVEYYKIKDGTGDVIGLIEQKIRERCGENAVFQIYGKGLVITDRIAIASLIRLRRAYQRNKMIAKKISIEYLLRTLGTRKILQALELSRAREEGKILVVAICGGCEISDLEWLIERVTIGEDDLLKGMKMLISARLEESIYGKIHLEEEREALEKNMIGCGLRLELEA
jgi:tRNA threonylcarbamoyladenosine modification (KEOPS) complex Cgi121 subunit